MTRTPIFTTLLLAGGALALLAGCSESEIAPEPASGGTSGSTSAGGAGGSGGAKALTCPAGTQGAKLIFVQTDTGAGYCIDQREVTRGEYKAFLDAKAGDVKGQPPGCAWNEGYAPVPDPEDPHGGYGCPTDSWALETYPDYPVVCVDICDAIAYCAWAGKRLCGVIGASATDLNQVPDHKTVAGGTSEWTYACTQGGKTQYPYGKTYEPGKCIDKARIDARGLTAREATTEPPESCHGTEPPFDQIFHMSGSVEEWMNICDNTFGTECFAGGGTIGQSPESLDCIPTHTITRGSIYPGTGFRCCANAAPAGP